MTVVVGDIVRIVAVAQWAAQDFFTNTYYLKITKQDRGSDDLFMDGIADHMDGGYIIINGKISSVVNYRHIEGQNITQDVLLPQKNWPTLVAGGDAGAALPTQCSACIFYRTLRPKTRAANFLWPFSEVSNGTGGVVEAAAIAVMDTFGTYWVDGLLETTMEGDYGAYNPLLARFTPVVAAISAARYRTQRRRRLGVGS